jgi:hypothetical protein
MDSVKSTVGDRSNPNGCPIPLTWFVIKYGTEPYCDLVSELWEGGHEIALHTRDHVRLDEPIDQEDTGEHAPLPRPIPTRDPEQEESLGQGFQEGGGGAPLPTHCRPPPASLPSPFCHLLLSASLTCGPAPPPPPPRLRRPNDGRQGLAERDVRRASGGHGGHAGPLPGQQPRLAQGGLGGHTGALGRRLQAWAA